MAKILEYDFERPWWLNPVVNGIGGGMASGGGGYIATGDPQTSGIVAVIGSIVTGGVTYALTRDRVFDKSGYGNTGFARNGAHIRDGRLVLPGKDEYVEVPNSPSLNPDSSDWTVKVSLNASKTQNEAFLWPLVKPRAEKRPAYYIIGTPDWPSVAFGVRDGEENKAEVRVEIPTQRDTDIGFVWDHPEIRVFVDGESWHPTETRMWAEWHPTCLSS